MDQRLADFVPFAVSLALGALVGIERERSQTEQHPASFPGGVRTFPLVALLGCAASWLGSELGLAIFAVVAVGFFALVVASYVVSSLKGASGTTTALASLLTFTFGVMVHHDRALLAAALAVSMTALLSLRRPLHELTNRIEQDDLYAALKLAALTVVVLPVLPDVTYGSPPYDVLNPFRLWLIVVLVAAMGFLGYVGVKLLGPGRGVVATGLLGGIVSSTAATYSLAGRSRDAPELSHPLALGIALAWSTMCVRVLLEVSAVNPALLRVAAAPVLAAMLAGLGGAGLVYVRAQHDAADHAVPYRNPFSVWSAVRFAAIFTAALLVAKFAEATFHDAGLLVAAGLSGTVEVDAMALTLAKLSGSGEVTPEVAVRGIALAIGSNTLVKAGLAAALGSRELRHALGPTVIATLGAGGCVLYFATSR
jgi:uncharacterized membrane protein (DUF4010 family)